MHGRWRRAAAAAVASGLAIVLMSTVGGAAKDLGGPPSVLDREVHRVTLITGDQVTLFPGPKDSWQTSVEPGKDRRGVVFRTERSGDQFYVIPSDVAALVAEGALDRRLFDVAGLAADGYGDRDTKAIPLIVTYSGKAGRSAVESSGAGQIRALPAVDGAAVRVDKKDAAAFLGSVAGSRLVAGVEKVWLDGKRELLLEESVPQIGAPAAWDVGYTGDDVKVAVLDGGVDATHPDLTGQVAESKNFSESPGGDPAGHGTHVAGTVAGTGAASGGRRKGVAPDATILAGKVCEDTGQCFESAILAGMQWAAAEEDADIINLSLGGADTLGIDPLEEAVNTLTEQTGALFVVAGGNEGPAAGTVRSPGSADAALTVGAVDKSDVLAEFSSRGPRVGDGGLKPDLTAPGVDIVAAKSEAASIGEPVDEVYLRLSGTSMATPHVAGVAALLAQQHPDWEAAELKGALMASAKQHPDQSVFEQGAGRVDAAAAIEQSVYATTPSLSFGTARWPHEDDERLTKTLTYRNVGNAAVSLELTASLVGPAGEPAPDGSISLSASELEIPAGGQAGVEVTAKTNHEGPDGIYTGRVSATGADGVALTLPVTVIKEAESYDLTLRHLGPDGEPAGEGFSGLWGLDTELSAENLWEADGEVTIRLPVGRYHLDTQIYGADGTSLYHLVQPVVALDQATTIDLDARTAKPVTHSVPDPNAVRSMLALTTTFDNADGSTGNSRSNALYVVDRPEVRFFTRFLGGGRPADEFVATAESEWSGGSDSAPTGYSLLDYRLGGYFTGHTMSPRDRDLAKVVSKVHAPGIVADGSKGWLAIVPGDGGGAPTLLFDGRLPVTRTHYLHAAPEVEWWSLLMVEELPGEATATMSSSDVSTYQAGKTYRDRWNAAVLGVRADGLTAVRTDNRLDFNASPLVDSGGHQAFYFTAEARSTKLYRNGRLLAEKAWQVLSVEDLPAERGDFRLEFSVVRDPALSGPLTTRVDSVWTFSSAASGNPGDNPLPLWAVRYQPNVDDFNAMKRQAVTRLPIRVESELGKDAAKLRKVAIEVSGDDGKTWRKARVTQTGDGRYLATFATPMGESVSLRASVADKEENTAKQTTIAAYRLR